MKSVSQRNLMNGAIPLALCIYTNIVIVPGNQSIVYVETVKNMIILYNEVKQIKMQKWFLAYFYKVVRCFSQYCALTTSIAVTKATLPCGIVELEL